MAREVLLSWSSGKDSAWALHLLRQDPAVRVVGLLTTFNRAADRVAMHAVRRPLVEAQAEAAGLPLSAVDLPWPCSNGDYEAIMLGVCREAVDKGVKAIAFGDLFLQDIRAYRERQLQGSGLEPLFPVWGVPTRGLALDMIAAGVRAKLTCVDPAQLHKSFAGSDFDLALLESLPPQVDPCGENGEFHTFVYESPVFRSPLCIAPGVIVERDGFVFADLLKSSTSEECSSAVP